MAENVHFFVTDGESCLSSAMFFKASLIFSSQDKVEQRKGGPIRQTGLIRMARKNKRASLFRTTDGVEVCWDP